MRRWRSCEPAGGTERSGGGHRYFRGNGTAPDEYLVLTPLSDSFTLFADNKPQYDVQEVRISLYARGSYMERKDQILHALLAAEVDITDRRFISHEDDTGYFHYAIDVAKSYEMEV